jgi:hypothetical protein
MFGDKRTNIMHGTCGATSGLGLTFVVCVLALPPPPVGTHSPEEPVADRCPPPCTSQAASQGVKPHIPLPSPNRVDNQGNWTDVSNVKKYGVGA